MQKLNIRSFDFSTMADDATVLLIGKRGTGKSTTLRNIMYHMRQRLDVGIAMCPTEDAATDEMGLRSFVPRTLIYDRFCPTALRELLDYQRKYIKKHGRENARRAFVILDDCCAQKGTFKVDEMREVHVNGRHRRIFLVNAVQYLMDVAPDLRTNIDYVFVLKENIIINRDKLYKQYFGMFDSPKTFYAAMDALTSGHSAMVLDNKTTSTNVEDCVFYFESAAKVPPFRLCSDVYWGLSDASLRPPGEQDSSAGPTPAHVARAEKEKVTVTRVRRKKEARKKQEEEQCLLNRRCSTVGVAAGDLRRA